MLIGLSPVVPLPLLAGLVCNIRAMRPRCQALILIYFRCASWQGNPEPLGSEGRAHRMSAMWVDEFVTLIICVDFTATFAIYAGINGNSLGGTLDHGASEDALAVADRAC